MRKKSKRILAAALSAILIWNTCEWQPQALAAGSLQRIGAETGADDTAETAEKESTSKESVLKASPSNASPSNAEIKDNRGESGTSKAEAGADADTGKAEAGADADTGKAEAGAESGANKAEAVYRTVCGPITPQCPASILQLHNDVVIVGDEEALSMVREAGVEICR